jgi:hypothetical protein
MQGSLYGAAPLGAVVAMVIWTAAAPAGAIGPRAAERSEAEEIESLSADIHVRRGLLSGTHTTLEGLPAATRYHLDRRRRGDRWTSVLTTTSPTRPPVVTPSGRDEDVPPTVVRVEDAGDGSALRFFTAAGEIREVDRLRQRLRGTEPLSMIPGAAELTAPPWGTAIDVAPPASRGSEWIEGLMPSRSRSSERRQALRQRWGSGGSLRGFDRFVVMSGAETTELLADPATGLIVEINHLKGARLERHAVMRYVDGPGDRLLRQSLRVERRLPRGGDLRDVTEIVVANVRTRDGR